MQYTTFRLEIPISQWRIGK